MPAYPPQFPLDSIQFVIAAVRENTIKNDLPTFLLHAWWVQGYAQNAILSRISTQAVGEEPEMPDIEPIVMLELVAAAHTPDAVTAQSLIPWEMLLQWAVAEILKQIKERWLAK